MLVFVQSLVPYNCPLKEEHRAGTKMLPLFSLWLLKKDIYTDTVLFSSTWKNMPPFHFHADHRIELFALLC